MRSIHFVALGVLMAGAASLCLGQAQNPNPVDIKETAEAIQTLQDQQKTIVDNQAKIDAKLATIADNVRVARIYQSRAR